MNFWTWNVLELKHTTLLIIVLYWYDYKSEDLLISTKYIVDFFSNRAYKSCGPGGPPHVKIVVEWDKETKD